MTTEAANEPVEVEKGEDDGEECPDFMEEGFLDNLAVVDSYFSDEGESADGVPTSSGSVPSAPGENVGDVSAAPSDKKDAKKSAVPAPVTDATIVKHGFIPRPVRAKISIRPRPTPVVFEDEEEPIDEDSLLLEAAALAKSEKVGAAKRAALKINGDHTLPSLFDSVVELESLDKAPARRAKDLRERLRSKEHDGGQVGRERTERRRSREVRSRERDNRPRSRERQLEVRPRPREREHRSKERERQPRSRERERQVKSRERERLPKSREREWRPKSRDRERIPKTREQERLPKSREQERKPKSRERDHVEARKPSVRTSSKDAKTETAVKRTDKRVEKVRAKPKELDSEENLLPPGTEDVLLPDAAAALKEAAAERAKRDADKARRAEKAVKTDKRRHASGDSLDGRKKPRSADEEMSRERIERDQERMSRELSLERLKELDRDLRYEKLRTSDRELERQRLVNEKLNEEIRRMREIRDRMRHERSVSRERSMERERRRIEENRARRDRGRRYGDLSPISVSRNSEFSMEMSPGRYEHRYEYARRSERSFSPISSGAESAGGGSSDRHRRRKRSPFWLEMERKLGISVVGGASYEFATAKEPVHYQAPLAAPVPMPIPQPLPAQYYAPPPVMYSVPPPAPVSTPAQIPAPALIPAPAHVPAPVPIPVPTPIPAPVQASAAAPLAPSDAELLLALGPMPDFKFRVQPEEPVPEAPPPPQISGENMSLTSFLEATVKAINGPASPTGRARRCKAATEAYLAGTLLPTIKFGRFVVDPNIDLHRYTSKTHFDHPAQETLMKLKSPLLRMSDIRLSFTEREAMKQKALSDSDSSSSDELEDVDSNDDIAIIAEVPKNKIIDMLDLDPVGDSSDADETPPCSECARRAAIARRDVAVNTVASKTTRDVGTQASALDDVSEESDGAGAEGDRTRALRSQYEKFRRSIDSGPQGAGQKGGPIGNQQKIGGPMGNQQKSVGPIGNQHKSGGPMGNQHKSGGPMGNQQKSGGPIGSQQKTGRPMGGQPMIGSLLSMPGTQLAGLAAPSGPMAARQDTDWRPSQPMLEPEAGQPLFQRRDALDGRTATETAAAKLQPLGGNTSFPRVLADSSFGNRFQPSPWVQPFQGQFQGGRPFQGTQSRPWTADSAGGATGSGGQRSTGLLGAAPSGLPFSGAATPFLSGGAFVPRGGPHNSGNVFGGQQNPLSVFGGNQNAASNQQKPNFFPGGQFK